MKYIIVGLGKFVFSLSIELKRKVHGVDRRQSHMCKSDKFKDRITHTVCLDAKDQHSLSTLPLKDTDVVLRILLSPNFLLSKRA